MSKYIKLGKTPESPQERLSLLNDHIQAEEGQDRIGLNIIQQRTIDFLVQQKGYPLESIEAHKTFLIRLPELTFTVKGDLVVSAKGRIAMMIKCAINSIESWERYSLAFCRTALEAYQIPFALVTDSEDYIIIDVLKGESIGGDRDSIPSYQKLLDIVNNTETMPCEVARVEREKRILHAFNALRCSEEGC